METYEVKSLRRPKLEHLSLNLADFATDQAWFESKDGTKVPMFLIRKKSVLPSVDNPPEKPIPTILYGYGGFGNSETPQFNLMNLIFMNNLNGMYVVANIRGGGEFGKQWHMSAVQDKKTKQLRRFHRCS
jgi:prolyl oligopeptidase